MLILVVVMPAFGPSGSVPSIALRLPTHFLPCALGLLLVAAAVTVLTRIELLNPLFEMRRADVLQCMFVASVTGVGDEFTRGRVARLTILWVMAIEAEITLVAERRWRSGRRLVARNAGRANTVVDRVRWLVPFVTIVAHFGRERHENLVLEVHKCSPRVGSRVVNMTGGAGTLA
jgi:hypothetical protein